MGPWKMSLVSKGAIFHFQDCWKKSKCEFQPQLFSWWFSYDSASGEGVLFGDFQMADATHHMTSDIKQIGGHLQIQKIKYQHP